MTVARANSATSAVARGVLLACLAIAVASPASAAPLRKPAPPAPPAPALLTEDQAEARAVQFLRGSDYGEFTIDVLDRLREHKLLTTGSNDCGPIRRPVWAFHLTNPHDGWLYIDAETGAKACSSLPFLR